MGASGYSSPLRYPGGKGCLSRLLAQAITLNGLKDVIYAEPYAGGSGAALGLLFAERVSRILINDIDPCVNAFWKAVLGQSKSFLQLLDETPITIDEWHRQRDIYRRPHRFSQLRVGFATFFLNRCNRSGILVSGGPIGGHKQGGKWKLDARYNREELRDRINTIHAYRSRISITGLDALEFLRSVVEPIASEKDVFVYLDPPYHEKGSLLYHNAYNDSAHEEVAEYLQEPRKFRWVLSYDNVCKIRTLYEDFQQLPFDLAYTAYKRRSGRELLICRRELTMPKDLQSWIYRRKVSPPPLNADAILAM